MANPHQSGGAQRGNQEKWTESVGSVLKRLPTGMFEQYQYGLLTIWGGTTLVADDITGRVELS